MPDPHKISVSILSADFTRLGEQIAEAEAAGVDEHERLALAGLSEASYRSFTV